MEFFPSLAELESAVLCPVETLAGALSNVPNIKVCVHTHTHPHTHTHTPPTHTVLVVWS